MAEVAAGRDQGLALCQPILLGDDDGDLAQQPLGLAQVGGGAVVLRLRVVVRQDADRTAEHIHWQGLFRQHSEQIRQRRRHQFGGFRQAVVELLQRRGVRQVAVQQQVGDLFKAGVLGQLGHRIAAVTQAALHG